MSEAWVALTIEDVDLNSAEKAAYKEELLTTGETARVDRILESVTMEVRGSIRSCRHNTLSDDPSLIPQSALFHAGAIARFRLMTNFTLPVSDDRREEYRDARRWLQAVAKCDYLIEAPGTADGTKAPSPAGPRFSNLKRTQSRSAADGS